MLVDLQNDYFPGCDMELVGIEEAAANAQSDVHASFMAAKRQGDSNKRSHRKHGITPSIVATMC
jgi:hypothetical protein